MSKFTDFLEKGDEKEQKTVATEDKQEQKVENDRQRDAFALFIALGANRSYKKVAEISGFSENTIRNWGSIFKWTDRAAAIEIESSKLAEQEAMKSLAAVKGQSLAILQFLRDKFQADVESGAIKITTLNEFATLAKLDNLLRGMPTDINENRNLNANAKDFLPDEAKKFLGHKSEEQKALPGDETIVDAEFTEDITRRFGLTHVGPKAD